MPTVVKGEVTINAETVNGNRASCTVNVTAVSTYGEIEFEYNENDHHFIVYENGTLEYIWSADGIVPSVNFVQGKQNGFPTDDVLPIPSYYSNVIINEGYTTIGNNAFSGSYRLTNVEIPDSVTTINGWAFSQCTALESIHIPDNVTMIGDNAFYKCVSLKRIDGLGHITSLGAVFTECFLLEYVRLPDTLTHLDPSAFNGCENLKELYIPDGVPYSDLYSMQFASQDILTIYCHPGSDAERFAQDRGINYAYY